MNAPPQLFDHALLQHRRARAARAPVDFLQREVATQVSERLQEVNRAFTSPAIIGPMARLWTDVLGQDATTYADADVLNLPPAAHDVVIHALALHWANDPVGQLVQCRYGLAEDGLFLGAFFGGRTLNELRSALAEAETALTGGLSPRVAPMGDLRDLGGLLQRAGFALPVADSVSLTVTYDTPLDLMHELRGMGETNVMHARHKTPLRRDVLQRACGIYAETFAQDDGRIPATFEVIFLTGWAPSDTQQKPLRPGSARTRLSDALGVPEQPTGEKPGQ